MKLLFNFDGQFLTAQHTNPSYFAVSHAVLAVDDDVVFIKDRYGLNNPTKFVISENLDLAIKLSLEICETLRDE